MKKLLILILKNLFIIVTVLKYFSEKLIGVILSKFVFTFLGRVY